MKPPIDGLKAAEPKGKDTITLPIHAVYADASEGPFRCDNCEHFIAPGTCNQPFIVNTHGPDVEAAACCDLFESLGKGK